MKIQNWLSVLFLVCLGGSLLQAQNGENFLLSATEFSKKYQDKDIVLLDVRTPEEYAQGHLKNSVNIDWKGDDFDKKIKKLGINEPVYIYCLSGGRSHTAAEKLRNEGYKVYEMQGGMLEWRKAGLPEVSDSNRKDNGGLSVEDFEKLTKSHPYVLIDFNAPWCGPCKKLKPYIEEIERELKGELKVIEINTDNNKNLARALQIYSIPYLILFKDGKQKWDHMGLVDKKYLKQVVEDFR